MCDMIQSICVTFVCVTWLIHKRRWFHIIDSYVACKIVQGDEDAYDALYCRSLSAKEPTIIGLFCRQYRLKIRHPTYLRHPVWVMAHVRMSHGTCVTWSSPYVWEWVMSHVRRVMSHMCMWHIRTRSCHTCDMTHSYVCSTAVESWPICDMIEFVCVTCTLFLSVPSSKLSGSWIVLKKKS